MRTVSAWLIENTIFPALAVTSGQRLLCSIKYSAYWVKSHRRNQPVLLASGKWWGGFRSGAQGKSDRPWNQKRPLTTSFRHECIWEAIQTEQGSSGWKFGYSMAGISWTGTSGSVFVSEKNNRSVRIQNKIAMIPWTGKLHPANKRKFR